MEIYKLNSEFWLCHYSLKHRHRNWIFSWKVLNFDSFCWDNKSFVPFEYNPSFATHTRGKTDATSMWVQFIRSALFSIMCVIQKILRLVNLMRKVNLQEHLNVTSRLFCCFAQILYYYLDSVAVGVVCNLTVKYIFTIAVLFVPYWNENTLLFPSKIFEVRAKEENTVNIPG